MPTPLATYYLLMTNMFATYLSNLEAEFRSPEVSRANYNILDIEACGLEGGLAGGWRVYEVRPGVPLARDVSFSRWYILARNNRRQKKGEVEVTVFMSSNYMRPAHLLPWMHALKIVLQPAFKLRGRWFRIGLSPSKL